MLEQIDRTKELETKGIGALLWEYAMPAVVSQIIASVYNIVDRVFLGQYVGGLAIAGLAITMPIMNVIHAFGSLVGAGSSARMSIVLGRKDVRWAEKILGNSVLLTFIFGFFFVTAGYVFMNPILQAFGASDATISFAREYMYIVLPGMFLTTLTFNLTGLIRASGYPNKSMWILIGGAVLNIALDALFIVLFGWGIAGAAWATTISMAVSSFFSVWHFMPKTLFGKHDEEVEIREIEPIAEAHRPQINTTIESVDAPVASVHRPRRRTQAFIRFKRHCWEPKSYIFRNILAIGISPFSMNLAASGVAVIINYQLIKYGGDFAVGTYGIINSVACIVFLLLLGICQGMQPIAGYNYGAQRADRLKQIYLLTLKVCVSVGVVGTLLCCFLPYPIIRCFTKETELIEMGIPAMRFMTIMMPLIGFTITNSQFFQSIDKPWIAIVTSLSRQVIFLIPMMFVVPLAFISCGGEGLTGVWCSCTVSDVLGAVLAAILLYSQRRIFSGDFSGEKERGPKKEYGPEKC